MTIYLLVRFYWHIPNSNTSITNRVSKIVQNSEAPILLNIQTSKSELLYVWDCLNHCFEGLSFNPWFSIGARLEWCAIFGTLYFCFILSHLIALFLIDSKHDLYRVKPISIKESRTCYCLNWWLVPIFACSSRIKVKPIKTSYRRPFFPNFKAWHICNCYYLFLFLEL